MLGNAFTAAARLALGALAAAVILATPLQAGEVEDLAGWWISVDDLLPRLWQEGDIVAVEELLVISPDGAVENRVMRFFGAFGTQTCLTSGLCSDAPLAATARLKRAGEALAFIDTAPTQIEVQFADPEHDAAFRDLLATGASEWSYALVADGNLLQLGLPRGSMVRQFARIDPVELGRLRQGFLVFGRSAALHWRCYFGNAMANDPAFAGLDGDPSAVPGDFSEFLEAAAYMAAVEQALRLPVPDDPALDGASSLPELELLLTPQSPEIPAPASLAERQDLARNHVPLLRAAMGEEGIDALPLSDAQLTAYRAARNLSEPYRALLCL